MNEAGTLKLSGRALASILLLCTGCVQSPPRGANDTVANTTASYRFKGNLNHHYGDDCWYRCFWR